MAKLGPIAASPAHIELERRRTRSPRQLAEELAQYYGRDFDQPWYIGAVALVARVKLGQIDDVKRLVEPYVNGSKDSLARPNSLIMAGHIVFTELARRTSDPRYVAAVRKVADLGFDKSGQMLQSMPYHDGYSDSVFMGTTIVAQAGALTGERKYFDMADRHLRFMEQLDLRPGWSLSPSQHRGRCMGPRQWLRCHWSCAHACGVAAQYRRARPRAAELSQAHGRPAAAADA